MRIHYYLEINKDLKIACIKCGAELCSASENYKLHVPFRQRMAGEIPGRRPKRPEFAVYYEYFCPGCYTMLDVETRPIDSQPIHDIEIKI